ncbi:hypothetical protein M3Y97_00083000 [Aphelenchoides bicaudatus]|nr:hypothetical protein M3Y97_00083000 [Aphelenchoides bicaudatus]
MIKQDNLQLPVFVFNKYIAWMWICMNKATCLRRTPWSTPSSKNSQNRLLAHEQTSNVGTFL